MDNKKIIKRPFGIYTMELSKSIKPISFFKAHAANLIKELNETHGTMIITQHGEAKAILQDIAEYERTQEALSLLKMVAQGQKDYEKGKNISAADMIAELKSLTNKKSDK
jgi:prevent-host-death family protein